MGRTRSWTGDTAGHLLAVVYMIPPLRYPQVAAAVIARVHTELVVVEVPATVAVLHPDYVRQTLRVSSAPPGGLARALRALRAAQSAGHRCALDARVLSPSYHVINPLSRPGVRFRCRIVLVRQFPSSLSNSARGLRGPSVAPLGHCPLTLTLGCVL